MHSKIKGNIGELVCASELSRLGYSVFKEFGDISKIDLIAEKNGKLLTIQCKSVTPHDGVLDMSVRKCGPNYVSLYDMSKIDYFSLYDLENRNLYLIPVEILANYKNSFILRLTESKNKQVYQSNWAQDYTIDKILAEK